MCYKAALICIAGSEPKSDAQYENLAKRSLQVPELMLVDRLPAGLWRQVIITFIHAGYDRYLITEDNLTVGILGHVIPYR
jgi:hypothetical protein